MAGGDVAALIPGPVGIDDLYLLTQPEDQPPTGSLPVPYSGFVIPDDVLNGTAKQHSQAGPDTIDFQALAAADSGVGVVSGGQVSPAGGMIVNVAAVSVVPTSSAVTTALGASQVSFTSDLTLDRWVLIVATATSVVASPGLLSAPLDSAHTGPVFPALMAGQVLLAAIYVTAGASSVAVADIVDKRLFLPPRPTVAQDGIVAQADSTQPLGVGYGTRAYNLNGQPVYQESPTLLGATNLDDFGMGVDATVTASSQTIRQLVVSGTKVWASGALAGVMRNIFLSTIVTVKAASISEITIFETSPQINGSGTVSVLNALQGNMRVNGTNIVTLFTGLESTVNMGTGSTCTTAKLIQVATIGAGTYGTVIGCDLTSIIPATFTTIWALNIGNTASYHNGAITIGGTATPAYTIDLQGAGNNAAGVATDAVIGSGFVTSTPASAASNKAWFGLWKGATNYYFAIGFNDGGTMRYTTIGILNGAGTPVIAKGASLPA